MSISWETKATRVVTVFAFQRMKQEVLGSHFTFLGDIKLMKAP